MGHHKVNAFAVRGVQRGWPVTVRHLSTKDGHLPRRRRPVAAYLFGSHVKARRTRTPAIQLTFTASTSGSATIHERSEKRHLCSPANCRSLNGATTV